MIPATLTLDTVHAGHVSVAYQFPDWPYASEMAATINAGRLYEPSTTRLIASVLRPGDVAIDGGGHVGTFAKLMAAIVGPTGQVISVEATPWNADVLRNQLADMPWARVEQAALGASPGTVTIHQNKDNDGGHAVWDPALHFQNIQSKAHPASLTVPLVTLDDLTANRPTPRLIKLDIEGSEYAAMQGATVLLARSDPPPFIICEINRTGLVWAGNGASETALRRLMADAGYECWHIADTEPALRELEPHETVAGNVVFNVLFKRPEADFG